MLHAKTFNSALNLIKIAKESGLKRSGIVTSKECKTIVEILASEQLDVPISQNKELLVSDDFIKLLVEQTNNKLESNHNRINLLEEMLKNQS